MRVFNPIKLFFTASVLYSSTFRLRITKSPSTEVNFSWNLKSALGLDLNNFCALEFPMLLKFWKIYPQNHCFVVLHINSK